MIRQDFVQWFRRSTPYIDAFRGRTFVIEFGGEMLDDAQFVHLAHDIALLNSLGVRLVLVHGARPQIEERLRARQAAIHYAHGRRITDEPALDCVKEAIGTLRIQIEAALSMGLANTPLARPRIRVASGNFVTAQPVGIENGVDFRYTGIVRRIDTEGIEQNLERGAVVLISPVGYSLTGETFNLTALDVATAVGSALNADKLICLIDARGLFDDQQQLIREITTAELEQQLSSAADDRQPLDSHLRACAKACRAGVKRAHLLDRHCDGALLLELFSRDGIGTMISAQLFEEIRPARLDDIGGLLELIQPLEDQGILVKRSREKLEREVGDFVVMERDGMITACAALFPFTAEKLAELACLSVHPDYRKLGRASALLARLEQKAMQSGIARLFALTTHASHWFIEHGFTAAEVHDLPLEKQKLYNYQRNSRVYIKDLVAVDLP